MKITLEKDDVEQAVKEYIVKRHTCTAGDVSNIRVSLMVDGITIEDTIETCQLIASIGKKK